MELLIILLIISVFIRRYIPFKGFLYDEAIGALTKFGKDRTDDLVVIDEEELKQRVKTKQPTKVQQKPTTKPKPVQEGIDLDDVKAKRYNEVNTDYIYSNLDSSDEPLASVVKKGLQSSKR